MTTRATSPLGPVPLLAVPLALGLLSWEGHSRLLDIEQQLAAIAISGDAEATRARALTRELRTLEDALASLRAELGETGEVALEARQLAGRISSAEVRLGDIGQVVEAQSTKLSSLQEECESFGPAVLEAELEARDSQLETRWRSLAVLLDQSREHLDSLVREVKARRDLRRMWSELVGPVVQLSGDSSVGSGVLLRSRYDDANEVYETYLVTAWHVVRDIQGDLSRTDMPVPTTIYGEDGTLRHEQARLLCFNPDLDAALLVLTTQEALPNGAVPASRERLEEIKIFDPVYAVGCPLGNDPIPTHGEIATCRHQVDGQTYWMINAPTYIGNSGGGIFDAETHQLVGIFSKIYTHGSLRPTIVPHMGLVTPLEAVYDWLATEGYGGVEGGGARVAHSGE